MDEIHNPIPITPKFHSPAPGKSLAIFFSLSKRLYSFRNKTKRKLFHESLHNPADRATQTNRNDYITSYIYRRKSRYLQWETHRFNDHFPRKRELSTARLILYIHFSRPQHMSYPSSTRTLPSWIRAQTVWIFSAQRFLLIVLYCYFVSVAVPCGRLTWPPVSLREHVNMSLISW